MSDTEAKTIAHLTGLLSEISGELQNARGLLGFVLQASGGSVTIPEALKTQANFAGKDVAMTGLENGDILVEIVDNEDGIVVQ